MIGWTPLHVRFLTSILWTSLLCLLAVWRPAQGETTECTPITSLPATITTQGIYCLTGNLNTNMTSGSAIEIQTNNVTIDLNGYKLGGLAAGNNTQAAGIYALNRKNITLRNGIIRGFLQGVWLEDNSGLDDTYGGHLLEDLQLDGNLYTALWVEGPGNLIRRNRVFDTGSSSPSDSGVGIAAAGPGARILDNDVDGTFGAPIAIGVYVSGADAAIIQSNRITETTSSGDSTYGIYRFGSYGARMTIEGNIVSNVSATGNTGIYVAAYQAVCGNNRVRGFATGIDSNCTDAGGNFEL